MHNLSKYICFKSKKNYVSLFLAVSSFLLFHITASSLSLGLFFSALFVLCGCLHIPIRRQWTGYLIYTVWTGFVVTALVFFPYWEILNDLMFSIMRHYISYFTVFLNISIIVSFILIFLSITTHFRLSVIITAILCSVLTIINGYVYRFRGTEFIFSDIFSSKTALNVVAQYNMQIQSNTLYAVTVIILLLFSIFCFSIDLPKHKTRLRLSAAISGIFFIFLFINAAKYASITTWNWDGTLKNGYYLNFYLSMRDNFIKKPESYSQETIARLNQQYASDNYSTFSDDQPNILVIMNESFADFRVFGSEVNSNIPITPFLDSLSENIIKGYALTSVYGGTTANVEFEFLTSFSTQFLPVGSVPYQQYIHNNIPSLAWTLDAYGYECMATHPHIANGWNRPAVYPRLGFSKSTFIDDYPQENLLREYVSDQEMYEYILAQLNLKENSPSFIFGITMQNHGGYYDCPEISDLIQLEGYSKEYPLAETYFTLLHQSDKALEFLLTELEKSSQKTIVLFFGDHFPNIESEFYEELYNNTFDTLNAKAKQYMVPFFIWANYDIPEQHIPCTSLIYLSHYLLESAGVGLPPFHRFLKELEQVIPAINNFCYYSDQEQAFISVEDAQGIEAEWLELYQILQYNGLIEKKNQSSVIFPYP